MSQLERPASLKRPPKPAADDKVDPIDTTPEAPQLRESPSSAPAGPAPQSNSKKAEAEATTASAPRTVGAGRREVTVPISTRVAPDVVTLLDEAVAREGITFRAAVEAAVRRTWGSA